MRETLPSGTPVEVVRPAGATTGLVVAADIGGLRPLFDEQAARLAADTGWAVAVVEPWPGREHLALEERLAAVGSLTDERQVGDLEAAADLLGGDRSVLLGFCMGGMYAFKAAATGRFDRVVSFYGMIRIPEQWASATQSEPLDALAAPGCCPVLAIVGSADPWTPSADIAELDAFEHVTVVSYEDADHGFVHDPDRPSHRAADAADAWRRAIDFLTPS